MKKLVSIALLVAMMLTLCVAVAEEPTIDFSTWVEVQLPDVGMHFYRPAEMNVSEDPATDGGENCAYIAMADNMTVAVYCIAMNDSTLATISASLTEQGYTVAENALTESGLVYDHLVVSLEGVENYVGVIFQGADGYYYDFECEELGEYGLYTFGAMLGTLSPIE